MHINIIIVYYEVLTNNISAPTSLLGPITADVTSISLAANTVTSSVCSYNTVYR